MSNIPIFLSSDNNYAPFVATTMASICDNTKSFIDFYILDGGISKENKAKICELKKQFSNFSIEFIKIDVEKEFASIEYKNAASHVSISTYNRFLIPVLKKEIEKAIYLDVDIIVLGDIKELYKQDLGKYALGAIIENLDGEMINEFKSRLNLTQDYIFNAGVMIFDIQKWRNKNIMKLLFEVEAKHRNKLNYADQDVLNIFFDSNFMLLDEKYNYMTNSQKKIDSFVVRHYNTSNKPWQADFTLNTKNRPIKIENTDIFWKYAEMTPFFEQIAKIKEDFLNSSILYKRFNKLVGGTNA